MTGEELVRFLWERFDAGDVDGAAAVLDEELVVEWPQSRERMRGRANFLAVNRNYPGVSRIEVRRIMTVGNVVISEVHIANGPSTLYAVSIFDIRGGKIVRATEYWGDTYEAPAWRARWVERY